jgi:hypothetical protein
MRTACHGLWCASTERNSCSRCSAWLERQPAGSRVLSQMPHTEDAKAAKLSPAGRASRGSAKNNPHPQTAAAIRSRLRPWLVLRRNAACGGAPPARTGRLSRYGRAFGPAMSLWADLYGRIPSFLRTV